MLKLIVPGAELYNEVTKEFVKTETTSLQLEHSLLAISKWESKFAKAFLTQSEKTTEEGLAYVKAMIIDSDVPDEVLHQLSSENLSEINNYISSPQSATIFRELPVRGGRGETITSELIYYWMVAFNIPFECETWHISRLFSLIRICNVKNSKQKQMPKHELAARNRELNAQRRAELKTSG